LVAALKGLDFGAMRKWCAEYHNSDSVRVMRRLYDDCYSMFVPATIPGIIMLIGDFQYRAAFVNDQEMHLAAFLVELMQGAEFL
jgi:hypothetical protein